MNDEPYLNDKMEIAIAALTISCVNLALITYTQYRNREPRIVITPEFRRAAEGFTAAVDRMRAQRQQLN